jgi:hypothetical protein
MLQRLNDNHIVEVLANLRPRDRDLLDKVMVLDADMLTKGYGIAYALQKEDTTIVIGGVRELWPGCGEAWMIASEYAEKYPIALTKAGERVMQEADDKGFDRIQCTVSQDFPDAQKWVEHLGFHVEGLLERYDVNGINHFMCARFNNARD